MSSQNDQVDVQQPQQKRVQYPQNFMQQPSPLQYPSGGSYFEQMTVHMLYHGMKDLEEKNRKLTETVEELQKTVTNLSEHGVANPSDEDKKKKIQHRKLPGPLHRCHAFTSGTGKRCRVKNQFDSKDSTETIMAKAFEKDGSTPSDMMFCNRHRDMRKEEGNDVKWMDVKRPSKRKRKSDSSGDSDDE